MSDTIYNRRLSAFAVRITNKYLLTPSASRVAFTWLDSSEKMTLIAVVMGDEFVTASEDLKKVSSESCGQGVSLYYLRQVPIEVAEKLVDHKQPGGFRYSSDKEAWTVAKTYADSMPFKSF